MGHTGPVTSRIDIQQLPPAGLVALGAASGAAIRWAFTTTFDNGVGLLLLNVMGSFLIGWLAGRKPSLARPLWLLVGTGFCGGLTSFSSFALDVARRLDDSQPASAVQATLVTVVLAVLAAIAGHRLAAATGTGQVRA